MAWPHPWTLHRGEKSRKAGTIESVAATMALNSVPSFFSVIARSPLNLLQKPLCTFSRQSRSYVYSLETPEEQDREGKKEQLEMENETEREPDDRKWMPVWYT